METNEKRLPVIEKELYRYWDKHPELSMWDIVDKISKVVEAYGVTQLNDDAFILGLHVLNKEESDG